VGAKCRARNGCDAAFFQHHVAKIFGTPTSVINLYPRIESAFWRKGTKSRHTVQIMYKLFATTRKLGHHTRRRTFAHIG